MEAQMLRRTDLPATRVFGWQEAVAAALLGGVLGYLAARLVEGAPRRSGPGRRLPPYGRRPVQEGERDAVRRHVQNRIRSYRRRAGDALDANDSY
jgi:hypothetical protein